MAERRVPRIRFKGFEEDWEQRKLGEMSSLITKGTTPLDKSNTGNVNFVNIESIDEASGEITITKKITNEEHEGYLRRSQLKENDILFSIAGTLGRVTSVKSSILPANTNQALAIIRRKTGDLQYVKTYLKGKVVSDYIKKNPTIGAQPNLSLEQVGNLEIALPILDEQKKIGEYFSGLNNLISLHQRKLEKLKILKKAMLEKMFPKNGEKVPEIRFSGFTEDWEQRKLGEIASEIVAGGDVNKKSIQEVGKYPVIANALTDGGIIGYYNEEYRISAPALTVTGRGDIGHAKVRLVNFTPVVRLLAIKAKHDMFFLENNINIKKAITESTGVPQLTIPQLAKYELFIPKKRSEEESVGMLFKYIDSLLSLHQRKLEKLRQIKKSMLERMFV